MRSIEARYKKVSNQKQNQGDFINLSQAVRGQRFTRKNITKSFKKIVPTKDYLKSEQKALIDNLVNASNTLEEGEI